MGVLEVEASLAGTGVGRGVGVGVGRGVGVFDVALAGTGVGREVTFADVGLDVAALGVGVASFRGGIDTTGFFVGPDAGDAGDAFALTVVTVLSFADVEASGAIACTPAGGVFSCCGAVLLKYFSAPSGCFSMAMRLHSASASSR